MTKHKHMLSCAPLAIAAMAALSTVPAAAQSQPQIVLDIPETQTAPATEPTIVLPEPEITIPEPVVTQATTPTETTQPETTTAPATAPVARESAPAPQPAAAAPVVAAPEVQPAEEAAAPLASLPETTATEAEIAANRADHEPAALPVQDASGAALILALLGVGGIALLAFFLMRRRRKLAAPVIERPAVTEQIRTPAPALERDTVVTTHDEPHAPAASVGRTATAAPAYAGRSDGAAVELPQDIPATFEERDSLLKRMINAHPDRANPFKSPRARAKRARLIMQSLGTSFRNRTPRIDLSQYTNIWPELRGWKPATA